MATKKVSFEIDLPDGLTNFDELNQQAKEAFVLDFLGRKKISQGKAAQLLGIDRWKLADLMEEHGIPFFDAEPVEFPSIVGLGSSGKSDIAAKHDQYLGK